MSKLLLKLIVALCLATFSISCSANPEITRLQAAAAASGAASVTYLPAWPADCRVTLDSKITADERLETYALRMKGSLVTQNDRITRCAGFYDDLGALE